MGQKEALGKILNYNVISVELLNSGSFGFVRKENCFSALNRPLLAAKPLKRNEAEDDSTVCIATRLFPPSLQ